jgi:hypothetical protein
MKNTGIYIIESPSGAVYIGQSRDISTRWKSHLRTPPSKHTIIHKSLNKYGAQAHKFKILLHLENAVDQCVLDCYEQKYIQLFKDNGFVVMNISPGGSAPMYGRKHTEAAKSKMSVSRSGVNNPNYGKGCFGAKSGRARAVIQYGLNGDYISEYSTITEASNTLNINRLSISNVVNHRAYTAGGFVWKYKSTTQ